MLGISARSIGRVKARHRDLDADILNVPCLSVSSEEKISLSSRVPPDQVVRPYDRRLHGVHYRFDLGRESRRPDARRAQDTAPLDAHRVAVAPTNSSLQPAASDTLAARWSRARRWNKRWWRSCRRCAVRWPRRCPHGTSWCVRVRPSTRIVVWSRRSRSRTIRALWDEARKREGLGEPGAPKAGQGVSARGARRNRNKKSGIRGELVGRERVRIGRGKTAAETAQQGGKRIGRHKSRLCWKNADQSARLMGLHI